jgi:hypothetical protein
MSTEAQSDKSALMLLGWECSGDQGFNEARVRVRIVLADPDSGARTIELDDAKKGP